MLGNFPEENSKRSISDYEEKSESEIFEKIHGGEYCSQERDFEFEKMLKLGKVSDLTGVFAKCAEDYFSFDSHEEGSDFGSDLIDFSRSGIEPIYVGKIFL